MMTKANVTRQWQRFPGSRILLLGIAGAAGTLCRFGLSGLAHSIAGTTFPWGTLAVNIAGCFTAGLAWSLFERRWPVSAETRTIIMIGFIGAFTTFSAYALESAELLQNARYLAAIGNFALNNGLGILALVTGIALGRLCLPMHRSRIIRNMPSEK